ncbi:hypothetical protein [Dactylosporangium sp. CS-033363]|uniref:hypothetical protein n=1 Tax=Dactylosporangium sp. CS-033363 TaxID=3239935 RepID=UPI003D9282D8
MNALIASVYSLVYSYLSPATLDALDTGMELERRRYSRGGGGIIGGCCCAVVVIAIVVVVIIMRRRRPRA